LYPILADFGYIEQSVLDEYTRIGNPLGDHPDMRHVPGIDFSSGSLGHGLSVALGMALAGRVQGAKFSVFALLGDGELHEGQVWEAAMGAAHHRTSRLVAIVDRNEYCLDGRVDDVIRVEPLAAKWEAFGWGVRIVHGHDVSELLDVLSELVMQEDHREPIVVIANTVKGKGVSFMETERGWHLGYLAGEDEARALNEIG
jgi:transketolase